MNSSTLFRQINIPRWIIFIVDLLICFFHQARNNDDQQVVMSMKQIVHEFKSKNSVFEELDLIPKAIL